MYKTGAAVSSKSWKVENRKPVLFKNGFFNAAPNHYKLKDTGYTYRTLTGFP